MISTDFAPNEHFADAIQALKILLQPWKWRSGGDTARAKRRLKRLFFHSSASISLYMTGRSALYCLMKTLHFDNNSEVIVQGFTCEAVVLPLQALGLRVVFADIHENDFSFDLTSLNKCITSRTRAIILQHTFGITPVCRREVLALARQKKITVIEDVAHGFQPDIFRKKGTSHILMSFGRSKSMSSVFGGAIVTYDSHLAKQLTETERLLTMPHIRTLLRIGLYKALTVLIKSTYDWYLGVLIHHICIHTGLLIPEITRKEKKGEFDPFFLHAYPNMCAYLLLPQLRTLNDVMKKRERITKLYEAKLAHTFIESPGSLTRFPLLTAQRDTHLQSLRKKKMYLGQWYTQPVAPADINLSAIGYTKGSCPRAEEIGARILNLPTAISRQQAHDIITLLTGHKEPV